MTVVVADVVDYDYGPTQPIIAGAVSGDSDVHDQLTRPNTAAGRASAISPRGSAVKRVLPQVDTFTRPRRSGRRTAIGVAIGVLLVLAALAIGRTVTRNYYYVADYNGTVSIMQGVQVSILGVALHQPYAQGCLNSHNQLSLIRYGQPSDTRDCQPMKLADLAESARAQVAAGLPVGTLEQADAQLRRLSTESLLPPCPPARGKSPPPSAPQAPPTTSQTPEPDAGTPVPEEPSGGPSETMAAPNFTTLPPPPPQPGTECRAAT